MNSSTAKSEKANMTNLKEGENCRRKDHVGRVAYQIDGADQRRLTPTDRVFSETASDNRQDH